MNQLKFILGAKKILSVNSLYSAKLVYMAGRPTATIYKSRDAKLTETYIKEQVRALNVSVNYPWITKNTLFKMDILVLFENGFLLRDLDNTLKLVQDAIFRELDINDSHVVDIVAHKRLCPGISEEKIFVCLSEVTQEDTRFDHIPSPHLIWCSEDIEFLKPAPPKQPKAGIKYKVSDKEKADTRVYIIRPTTYIPSFTAELIQDVMTCISLSRGFVYILGIGGDFVESEFRAGLEKLASQYSGIKFINDLKEI